MAAIKLEAITGIAGPFSFSVKTLLLLRETLVMTHLPVFGQPQKVEIVGGGCGAGLFVPGDTIASLPEEQPQAAQKCYAEYLTADD